MESAMEIYYIFRAAIEDEKKAQRRYEEAIEITRDRPELQEAFRVILEEEKRHEKILSNLYGKFKEELSK